MGTVDLDTAVGLLTRTTKHLARGDGGTLRFIDSPPLLLQLRQEIANSSNRGKGGSSGPTIPIGAAALDLLQEIEEEVTENFWNTYALHRGTGRGTLVGELLAWAIAARIDPDGLAIATRAMTGYVQRIEALIQPRHRPRTGRCPECGNEWMQVTSEEGVIWQPVLVVDYDDDGMTGAQCLFCWHSWTTDELEGLANNGQETK